MNDLIIKENIENMIYEIRGKQVMLDSDLAKLYNCKNGTKEINQAVNRNNNKFPERFSWILTDEESDTLLVTICDQKIEKRGGKFKNPRVFTEQGIAMLATILKSKVATEVSIKIMDAFVLMRKYINNNKNLLLNIETKLIEHDNKIDILFDKLESKEKINHIFFEGQIYDAYSLLIDVLSKANEEIIIIDNYASKELFDILKHMKVKIKIITKNIDETLIKKYNKQYCNIEIINNNEFHDRFIIIDKRLLYHSGASFKDLGNKCFSINKIEDKNYLKQLLQTIFLR